jgi:DNA-binding beta-propeller fold protein YncE
MRQTVCVGSGLLLFIAIFMSLCPVLIGTPVGAQAPNTHPREVPKFEVDPAFKVPGNLVIGELEAVSIDDQDHVWALTTSPHEYNGRAQTVKPGRSNKLAPLLEFDAAGNFIQAWGGSSDGYDWPSSEHGLTVDYKGYVWVSGEGQHDDQILKFTKDGKFVLQIGRRGESRNSRDPNNVLGVGASDIAVYAPTNEVFVAEYHNERVVVFDADTGTFKRMWGAFGHVPPFYSNTYLSLLDQGPERHAYDVSQAHGDGATQFSRLHSVRVSNDGLVYVADKGNLRIQVFTVEGKYQTQVFVSREELPPSKLSGTVFGIPRREFADEAARISASVQRMAFSPDPQQRFLYVADRRTGRVLIYDRKTLEMLGAFGETGTEPGQFLTIHDVAVDSKGNIYTTENEEPGTNRVQKFLFKGMSSVTTK